MQGDNRIIEIRRPSVVYKEPLHADGQDHPGYVISHFLLRATDLSIENLKEDTYTELDKVRKQMLSSEIAFLGEHCEVFKNQAEVDKYKAFHTSISTEFVTQLKAISALIKKFLELNENVVYPKNLIRVEISLDNDIWFTPTGIIKSRAKVATWRFRSFDTSIWVSPTRHMYHRNNTVTEKGFIYK